MDWPADSFCDRFFDQSFYDNPSERVRKLAISVFENDGYTCAFCEFQCDPTSEVWSAFFQVKAIDNNYKNLDKSNLRTICSFCHCHFNLRATYASRKFAPGLTNMPPTTLSILSKAVLSLTARREFVGDAASAIYKDVFTPMISDLFSVMPEVPTARNREGADTLSLKIDSAIDFVHSLIVLSDGDFSVKQTQFLLSNTLPLPVKGAFDREANFWYENVFKKALQSENISSFMGKI